MDLNNYKNTKKYWEDHAKIASDFSGFKIDDEANGQYRLEKEFSVLKKIMTNFVLKHKIKLKILDVGCARGNFINFFLDYGTVSGVDFAENYVEFCQEKFVKNQEVKILRGDILELDLQDKFDVIFVGGVLPYIKDEDLDRAINNLVALLEEGGIIIFREVTMSKKTITTKEGEDYMMLCFRRKLDDYKNKFAQHNLNIIGIIPNYACTYTTLISKYKNFFHLNNNIFKNKIIEFIFLYIPYRIFLFIRKNMFTYHFIIVNKI